jgi:GTP-binding protein YchF
MEAGIVGLPNVGKSTLFNALTSSQAAQSANYPFCTIEPNEGIVSVPDRRLDRIATIIEPQKVIPTALKLVDIAGIVKGASEGQGLGNKFLSHIREVDAIVQVVRCFEDPDVTHVAGRVDPVDDLMTIDLELILADIQSLETALPKAQRAARAGDKEAKVRQSVIELCLECLKREQPVRSLQLDDVQRHALQGFGLLSAKPLLYLANVDDDDLQGKSPLVQQVRQEADLRGAQVIAVSAKLEAELAELPEPDRDEMLADLGLETPALESVAQAIYHTLGLHSFFTAGPKEVRAWPVAIGATAPEAAGVIHSDFQRGFIRAEVYQLDDLEQYRAEKEIRAAGKLRLEGKNYVIQNGDICHFLFNV